MTEEGHQNLMGAMATNLLSEQSSGLPTHRIESLIIKFGFENTAGIAQAKMNKGFDRKELGKGHADGGFHQLNDKMKHFLVLVALKLVP